MIVHGVAQSPRRIVFTDDARFTVAEPVANKPTTLSGYPIVWSVLTTDRGGYKVRLKPGSAAFTTNTHAVFHHDFRDLLGDTESATLRIQPADAFGIPVEIDLPDTTVGRDVHELVRTKRIRGMSFAMVTTPRAKTTVENGETILDVESFVCDEVTVTGRPAFLQTEIGVKPEPEFAATRVAQALRLERFKLDRYRLAGASPHKAV